MGVAVRRMRVALLGGVLMALVAGSAPALAAPARPTPPTLPPGVTMPETPTIPSRAAPAAGSVTSSSSTSTTTPGSPSTTLVRSSSTTLANSTSTTTSSTVAPGAAGPSVAAATAGSGFPRSQNIALVPDVHGQEDHGGAFPTTGFPDGYAPVFTNVRPEAIRDNATDPIGSGYDTIVLNSICGIAGFLSNGQFKARIEGFASRGGKVLIWDSECTSTDYSNFAIPFKTSNPGQRGAHGTLTDTEDNTLSSTNPASKSYVNLKAVAEGTDAVGDANVFTTFDPRWFLDLKATNTLGVNGAAQAYANLGKGIVIYNGLDKDDLGGGGFDPTSTSGSVHLNRIWMLDLLQAWNPDGLPHANPVVNNGGFNIQVSPPQGRPFTRFGFKFTCPNSPNVTTLDILDPAGHAATRGVHIDKVVISPNNRDFTRTVTVDDNGTYDGVVTCDGTVVGKARFTVKAAAYVALGDSYASGEGASSFDSATDKPGVNMCHRATNGWAYTVARSANLAADMDLAACSGGLIEDFGQPNQTNGNDFAVSGSDSEMPQLNHLGGQNQATNTTQLVTLSVGGNNVGFPNVVNDCIGGLGASGKGGCRNRDGVKVGEAMEWLLFGRPDSTNRPGGCNTLPGIAASGPYEGKPEPVCRAAPALHTLYEDIVSRLALNGTLVVVGYPQLFGTPRRNCRVADPSDGNHPSIALSDVVWLNQRAILLDGIIQAEVGRATAWARSPKGPYGGGRPDVKIVYAPVDPKFNTHRLCDSSKPWINQVLFDPQLTTIGLAANHLSFHPNKDGQMAQASAVIAALPK